MGVEERVMVFGVKRICGDRFIQCIFVFQILGGKGWFVIYSGSLVELGYLFVSLG